MTDNVYKLAQGIIDLINSRPQSPTSMEIASLVYAALEKRTADRAKLSKTRSLLLPGLYEVGHNTDRQFDMVVEGDEYIRIDSYPAGRATYTRIAVADLDAAEAVEGGVSKLFHKHIETHLQRPYVRKANR